MNKVLSLSKKLEAIKTTTVKLVNKQCPIDDSLITGKHLDYEKCLKCPYLVQRKKDGDCGWYKYETKIIEARDEHRPHPGRSYPRIFWHRTIKCANCGSEMEFSSTCSGFVKGEKMKCPDCQLLHTFLKTEERGKDLMSVFALPIKEWEEKQK